MTTMREVSYDEWYHLHDIGIIDMLHKRGKSGVVTWIIPFGSLDILANRKEGIVGSMLRIREYKTKLLPSGIL